MNIDTSVIPLLEKKPVKKSNLLLMPFSSFQENWVSDGYRKTGLAKPSSAMLNFSV